MSRFFVVRALKFTMIFGLSLAGSAVVASPSKSSLSCSASHFDKAVSLTQAAQEIVCDTVNRRLLIVGDYPGSNEIPDFIGELISDVSAQRPVRLGLEIEAFEQKPIQIYMASRNSADDRAALMHDGFWANGDGRTSQAVLRLLERVRKLRTERRDVNVFTMVPNYPGDAPIALANGINAYRSDGMAQAIHSEVAHGAPHQLVIVLMINIHGTYASIDRNKNATVPERLLKDSPYLVNLDLQGGSAWNCRAGGCGPHVLTNRATHADASSLLRKTRDESGAPTQVWLRFPPLTASPPAKQKKSAS